ncbi:hypothetical protein ACA910_008519 [Epithemia clementina (nom. ined.)]
MASSNPKNKSPHTQSDQEKDSTNKRRRSTRGNASINELAQLIVKGEKKVLIVTGAGVSVASGIRPFRTFNGKYMSDPKKHGVLPTTAGLWNDVIWTTATREAFRKDPLRWYNEFWIPHFMNGGKYLPNMGHYALKELLEEFSNVTQITQNIDGLQANSDRLIEAHGRIGLYKCLGDDDSDTDSNSDDDEDRPVHLGHRRKSREKVKDTKSPSCCPYRFLKSLDASQLEPPTVREALCTLHDRGTHTTPLVRAPICPICRAVVLPQTLLFDEGYHSHAFYQFERMESLLEQADVLVFCGTSFSVQLTESALDVAKERKLPVYNFNLHDFLAPTPRLNAINIAGPAVETLPLLMATCRELKDQSRQRPARSCRRRGVVYK